MTITKLIQTAILFIAALITIQTIYSPVVEAEQNSILLISKLEVQAMSGTKTSRL